MNDRDKELELLERDFLKFAPDLNEAPPTKVSDLIKSIAGERVRQSMRADVTPSSAPVSPLFSHAREPQSPTAARSKPSYWPIGMSLAAGVLMGLIGASGLRYLSYQAPTGQSPSSQPIWMSGTVPEGVLKLEEAPAEQWQRYIAELVMTGELDQAQIAIYRFQQKFPNWPAGQQQPTEAP